MRVIPLGATAVLALYGFSAVALGFDKLSEGAFVLERAVPKPFRAGAYRSAALLAVINEDGPKAVDAAARAVWHDPVNPNSAAVLGSAYMLAGDAANADKAYRVAALFGWRNQSTQTYWYGVALAAGDYEVAADRADAILRMRPELANSSPLLQPLESAPAAKPFLTARIKEYPNWVQYFYMNIFYVEDEATVSRRAQMVAGASPIGCDKVSIFVKGLMAKNRQADAVSIWNANCPDARVDGLIADARFADIEREKMPFGWFSYSTGDVAIRQLGPGEGVEVANQSATTRRVMFQNVSWDGGRYKVTLAADGDQGAAAGRFIFSFGCGEAGTYSARSAGDPVQGGQILEAEGCPDGRLAMWLKPGSAPVRLKELRVEKVS